MSSCRADAEVGLRSGLHAVRTVAQVDGVEVALEDLLLRHDLLEPARQHGLSGLAVDRLLIAVLGLDQLLGDRGTALHDGAGVDVAHQGADSGTQVHPVVGVELGVLDGQNRGDRVLRDGAERHWLPVDLRLKRGEQGAIRGVDVGALVEGAEDDLRLL